MRFKLENEKTMKKMTLCDNGLSIRTLRFLVVLSAWFAVTLCNAQDNAILKTAKGSAITKKHAVRDAGTKLAMTKLFASPQFYGIKNATPVPDGMARIVLEAGDLWGDGSGYQFLMGKNLYGSVIPERGALTQGCPAPDGLYDYFEYKIPVNADGSCETTNVVMNNSLSIDVPADVYDYCVVNPTPGDKIWIAGNGRVWDMEFKPGVTYYFTVVRQGSGDAVSLECIYAADDLPDRKSVV